MSDRRIVLCTGNPGKLAELKLLLPAGIELLSLADVGLPIDLPETGDTLEANALQKARFAHERCGLPCIADDTGLEVDALNGAPGVLSARYAGPAKDPQENMRRLLRELDDRKFRGAAERSARFRTVLAFVDVDGERTFAGEVRGSITHEQRGTAGFGYDPVFLPDGSTLTFAEIDMATKNKVSHRARAISALLRHLAEQTD